MSGLRIGVNALYLIPGGVGGTEIYLRSLLRAVSELESGHELLVFVNRETGAELAAEAPQCRYFVCGVNASSRPARILYEQFVLPRILRENRVHVLLNPGFTMPAYAKCPSVTVFHDLQHKRHPEFFRKLDLIFWDVLLASAAKRSKRLIAVSPATAVDLETYLPVSKGKIRVVPHGVDPEMYRIAERRERIQPHLQHPFVLTVSTLHPHKNFARLLDAFADFRASHPRHRLVVVGLKGFAANRILAHSKTRGLTRAVDFRGWIPRDELYRLYENADAFVYPSLFEGFGMPVAEALAAGIPTACSAIQPLEWVAGKAAKLFDPLKTDAIRRALEQITVDRAFRERARRAGPAQVKQATWRQSAQATVEELERAVK